MRIVSTLLLSTLLLSACGRHDRDARGVGRGEVLLRVSAGGEAETRPDMARFSAGVSSIAASSQGATEANNKKMNKVMAEIEALGVKADDTQTQALSVGRIEYGRNKGQFEASNTVSVKVRKIDDAGKVIAAATGAGANIISGPDLTIDDKEAASKGAYAAAYKAARTRAEAYAEAAGLKVARILSITDGSAMYEPIDYGIQAMDASAGVPPPPQISRPMSPPIRAGLSTSTAQVRVDFVLGE
jgi:uncharacterized protein